MASTYTQLRAELQAIAPWLIPVISTCSAPGSAVTLVDTYLFTSTASTYLTTKSGAGVWVARYTAAAVGDRERRIASLAPATGVITTDGPNYTNSPANAEAYELWAIQPQLAFNLLLTTMNNFPQAVYAPIPRFTDADMEVAGVGSWTASNVTLTKDTGAGNVAQGSQALKAVLTSASGYAEGGAVNVIPGQTYFVSAHSRISGAGGPAILVVWDKTNNAEIEIGNRVSHALEAFMPMQRTFTTPATCEQVAVRLYGTATNDTIYWDCVHGPTKSSDEVLMAPSFLSRAVDLRKIYEARYTQAHPSQAGVYDAASRIFLDQGFIKGRDFHLRSNAGDANPYRIEFARALPLAELWLEMDRFAGDLTAFVFTAAGETSPTTSLNRRLIALVWAERICSHILSYRADDSEIKATLGAVRTELKPLMADYTQDLETPHYPPINAGWNLTRV